MVRMKIDAPEPPSFKSEWPVRCVGCGDTHPAGTLATYQGTGKDLLALECIGMEPAQRNETIEEDVFNLVPTEAEQAEARKRMCDRCWMVLPASGVCGSCF